MRTGEATRPRAQPRRTPAAAERAGTARSRGGWAQDRRRRQWGLLAPLAAGAAVGEGWQVAELGPVQAGASVLTLAHASGRTRRIHLCRNGGAPVGLVHTGAVDLVVMNGGAGEEPTEESLAQAVATVAHAVARNEAAADVAAVGLLAHAERLERFGASAQLR
ncbi:hypothetical protein KF840_12340 [bacterium]|nr:hypothetical protein [bacterium]